MIAWGVSPIRARFHWSTAVRPCRVQVPARSLMLDDGEVERRFASFARWSIPLSAAMMPQTHWQEAGRDTFTAPGKPKSPRFPSHRQQIQIVAGLLCRSGSVCQRVDSVYRSRPTVASAFMVARFAAWPARWIRRSNLSPDDPSPLIDGKTILDLAEGLSQARRVMGGPDRIDRFFRADAGSLSAYGLSARSLWKLSFFIQSMGPVLQSSASAGALPIVRIADRRRRDMPCNAAELAHRLAREAERCAVIISQRPSRWQLLAGRDVRNTAGRSMFVLLEPKERAAALRANGPTRQPVSMGSLDVIRESCGLVDFHDVTEEARRS